MKDRSAVLTMLNGEIIEWKVFDNPDKAHKHYNQEIERVRNTLEQSDDGDWGIMLCNINQYAVSRPHGEPVSSTPARSNRRAKYASVLAAGTKKITGVPSALTLQAER